MMIRIRTSRDGFTLIELMIVIVMMMGITGATLALFKSQSVSFRKNTERFDLVQNARGAIEFSERTVRTMGAGVPAEQPMLVYGSGTVLAFNSDYTENDTTDVRWAAYWNPDTPLGEIQAWDVANAEVIPNSSPSYTYPSVTYLLGNGTPSPAETYILYFEGDDDTPRSDDYILWQQVNAGDPEMLARNLLAPTAGNFFEYLLHRSTASGDTLILADGSLLPLVRRQLVGGISTADSAAYVRPDSVRAVRLSYRVTNGLSGTDERTREVRTTIEVPNNGILMPTVCGRSPLPPGAFTATDTVPGSGRIWLNWTRSDDQDAGEQDVRQYVLWRRLSSVAAWQEPLLIVRAETGVTDYTSEISDNTPGETYIFGLAAQDCTPNFSTAMSITTTASVGP